MKKPRIIFASVFTLLVIIGIVFLVTNKESGSPEDSQVSTNTSSSTMAEQRAPKTTTASLETDSPGQYIEYSEANLAGAKGQKVLFFHAPWCPQCRSIEKSILENKGSIPAGITILKVDYDSNHALRQKYGVTIQTTFVKIDDSGELIDKYVAYDEPTIESVRKNFLL